jgi:type IV pilus assembly protein PilW
MQRVPSSRRHASGFSLTDLIVGLAIGLLAMLVILQVTVLFESRRKATVSGADAQLSGSHVLAAIGRDLRHAGYGLGPPEALACSVKRHYVQPIPDLVLQPVTIIDGGGSAPDTLQILASAKTENSAPARLIAAHAADVDRLMVNSTLAITVKDLLVLQEAGKPCTLLQATAVPPSDYRVFHQGAASNWNPADPASLLPAGGYGNDAAVINLGALDWRSYSIDAGGQLLLSRYQSSDNNWQSMTLAADIVNLQAEYGFDNRAGSQASPQITTWQASMIDADGNGVVGDNGDLRRLLAVRIAIVARSAQREIPDSGSCSAAVPRWLADADGGLSDTTIAVDHFADGSANPDWQCYRYRVFQTVVPMRNLLWNQ